MELRGARCLQGCVSLVGPPDEPSCPRAVLGEGCPGGRGREVHPENVDAAAEVHREGHGSEAGGPGDDAELRAVAVARGWKGPPVVAEILLELKSAEDGEAEDGGVKTGGQEAAE